MKKAAKWIGGIIAILLISLFIFREKVQETRAFINGAQAYVYGFPLVMMDVTRDVMTGSSKSGELKAPINQFARIRTYVTPEFKDVVRISVNSLWSHGFVDLNEEAWVISYPATGGRYMVVQVLNMWTDDFVSAGTRTTGSDSGNLLIVGPNWKGNTPADVTKIFRSSTRYAWVLVQMACGSPDEYASVHILQDQLKMTPLSGWGKSYTPSDSVAVNPDADLTATPFDQVRLMTGVAFFDRLADALKDNPAYMDDENMLKKLKWLGIEAGKDFDPDKVSPSVAKGMNKAAAKVFGMLGTAQYEMKGVNGWLIPMNVGRFGTDYETRAFMAFAGLGALTSDDCLYPTTFVDSKGRVLDAGSKYVIHFEKNKIPPSHSGVWSISAYRENFYVHNPIERYGILSSMPLKYNTDSSLDIYIQRNTPGKDKESNWLPCPPSLPFNLSMRVYQPKKEILDGRTEKNVMVEPGTYVIPAVTKVE